METVRFWLSGPRMLGIRPGISFRPDEVRGVGLVLAALFAYALVGGFVLSLFWDSIFAPS